MLDRSIEFHSIIMRSRNERDLLAPELPERFSVRFYQPGDGEHWARIQTAVLEFETCADALECFRHYLPQEDALRRRQLYIVDDAKEMPVATATAWFTERDGVPVGTVHALSCLPEYQSRGLGRAAAVYMMRVFRDMMPGCVVWLDTQTWSYKAIGIYMDLGFVPMRTAVYNDVPNEYDAAVNVLKDRMREDVYLRFLACAE